MKNMALFGIITLTTVLFGCDAQMTPEQLYSAGKPFNIAAYKFNVTQAQSQDDTLTCKIEASQRVPQNIQINSTPTYTTPAYTTCNNIGYSTYCNTSGGQTYGGDTYSVDANTGLRNQALAQCMSRKGYRSAAIPPCPAGVTPANLKGNGNRLPRLGQNTCYIAKGGVQVIGNR